MICTKCKHLDGRNGECLRLNWQVICQQCGKPYPINEIRCPSCVTASTVVAGVLTKDSHGDWLAAALCPLTDQERNDLSARQAAPPPLTQAVLFS